MEKEGELIEKQKYILELEKAVEVASGWQAKADEAVIRLYQVKEQIAALTLENRRQAEEIRVLRNALCDYNPDHAALNREKEGRDETIKKEAVIVANTELFQAGNMPKL